MKRISITGLLITITFFSFGQKIDAVINVAEVERIEKVLAADEMKGRRVFSPEIEKAADFIEAEFRAAQLRPIDGSEQYRQSFTVVQRKIKTIAVEADGIAIDPSKVVLLSSNPSVRFTQGNETETLYIKPGLSLSREAAAIKQYRKNMLVVVDDSYASVFNRLNRRNIFKTDKAIVFVLGKTLPANFSVTAEQDITEQKMSNVVGIIPGKSKKNELVVFSAHYDHIGTGTPVNGDSIYNGANDDAAGTTAVIMLARYFKEMKNNERTLVFAAFTAEESGGYGSQYFSRQFDADKVVAMFNIEMIGTESKWGKNSAYITGYEKTDMGSLLQKNLSGTGFTFHPDPYPDQQLFYRSDNATLARLGVPAHTVSTSKMDDEPNYHKVTDHIETLDMQNMAMIIKAIALSATGIVMGKETPSRVKPEELIR